MQSIPQRSSVSDMLAELECPTLETRQLKIVRARLTLSHKITNRMVAIDPHVEGPQQYLVSKVELVLIEEKTTSIHPVTA